MRSFYGANRVMVIDKDSPFCGIHGTIERRRMSDNGAWIALDTWPDGAPRSFPANDPHGRGNNVILYPDQCKAEA